MNMMEDFSFYLDSLPRLLAADAEHCGKQIISAEPQDGLVGYTRNKSFGLDDLPYEFYINMPHLFSDLLE